MTNYIFQENKFTEAFDFSYEPWLFQLPEYLTIQSSEWVTFCVRNEKSKSIEAHVHVFIKDNKAISPHRAPFGSIQFSSSLKPPVLFDFVEFVCARLKEKGVIHLTLKNHPDAYDPYASSLLNCFLLNIGFQVETAEVGAVLRTDYDFMKGLSTWQLKKFRQLENANLSFDRVNIDELESVNQFILDCRKERNYPPSIDWNTLEKTVNTFPDRFHLFQVFHNKETAAASISISVGDKILYNFLLAHPRKFDKLSPVVILLKGIHQFCRENNYRLLDLGTSALGVRPNFGLLNFKLGLGATPTMKLTFNKKL